jgi:hypothetical protein
MTKSARSWRIFSERTPLLALPAALLLAACPQPEGGTETDTDTTGQSTTDESSTSTTSATTVAVTSEGETTTTTDTTDTGADPLEPEAYGTWLKREPPGAVCSNGSQYKIFVNFSETGSKDLLIYLEPGGACWDYETCSGKSSLGAANPNGIPDSHMEKYGALSPILRRDVLDNPARDWNLVFIPYCTGDVHTGNNVMIYEDPDGVEAPLEYRHNGHDNIMRSIDYLSAQFPELGRLMVTGCSAGGAGSIINYFFFRSGLAPDRGYMLNDSGPIFPSGGFSQPLHTKIRASWDVDPILESIPEGAAIKADFGALNTMLADMFPEDRLSTVYFQRDYNYSRYSYERFYPEPNKEKILSYWAKDTALLTEMYDQRDNLAYYLPYWRPFNDSHCAGIVTYDGGEIQEQDMTLPAFIDELLDDGAPLESYIESPQPGEDP